MQNGSTSITIEIDELPDNTAIFRFKEGNFIFVDLNINAQETEKTSKEKFLGKKLTEVFPGVKEFGLFDVLLQVYEDGISRELDTRLYKDDKIYGWRYNSVKKLSNGNLIVFYKDVTDYKLLEARVNHMDRENTQKRKEMLLLAKALEQTDDMVLITDANGIIEYVNDATSLKTGYDKNELIGKKTNIFKSGKHTKEFYEKLWKTILSGQNYHNVVIDKTKDNRCYYIDLKITPLMDKDNNIQNFVSTSTDITSRVEMENRLKKLASIDSLTGVYNRYKIDDEINLQIARFKRKKKPFCILMFDIDYFKSVNDTYGHDVGDKVLKDLCKMVLSNIRTTDILGRWGGEEFIIILDETTQGTAVEIGEKLRKVTQNHLIDGRYKVTISIGITQYKELLTREDLTKKADEALYRAKDKGRNQVSV